MHLIVLLAAIAYVELVTAPNRHPSRAGKAELRRR